MLNSLSRGTLAFLSPLSSCEKLTQISTRIKLSSLSVVHVKKLRDFYNQLKPLPSCRSRGLIQLCLEFQILERIALTCSQLYWESGRYVGKNTELCVSWTFLKYFSISSGSAHPFLFKWRNRQITVEGGLGGSGIQAIIWNDDNMYFSFDIVDTSRHSLPTIKMTNRGDFASLALRRH